MTETAPTHLGKYEILRHLATGGMAELHLARASGIEGFEKLVVIKRILPQLASNVDFVRMFLDEARLAAMLQHPNVVQVYDIGSVDGSYFFAMEFLHGEDVRHVVEAAAALSRSLPLEHAIAVVIGACAGLHYAHEKLDLDGRPLHLVHRDVSPQNVFVTHDGGVKLLDFGIAKASHRLAETRNGTLKGKIRYMSPEQCCSEVLDRRSDVFALAILLWELTTGNDLYGWKNDFDAMKAIVERDAPSPLTVNAEYPAELERIVMKGLRRDASERYQTVQAMQEELEAFARERKLNTSALNLSRYMRELFGEKIDARQDVRSLVEASVHARPLARRPRRRVLLWVGGAIAALVLIGLAVTGMNRLSDPARPPPSSPRPLPIASAPAAPVPAVTPPAPVAAVPTPVVPAPAPVVPRPKSRRAVSHPAIVTPKPSPVRNWDKDSPWPPGYSAPTTK